MCVCVCLCACPCVRSRVFTAVADHLFNIMPEAAMAFVVYLLAKSALYDDDLETDFQDAQK
jgi:hypothetical protein